MARWGDWGVILAPLPETDIVVFPRSDTEEHVFTVARVRRFVEDTSDMSLHDMLQLFPEFEMDAHPHDPGTALQAFVDQRVQFTDFDGGHTLIGHRETISQQVFLTLALF